MVVSNQRVKSETHHIFAWQYVSAALERLLLAPVRMAVSSSYRMLKSAELSSVPISESNDLRREYARDRHDSPALLVGRSPLMFRRENPDESFDDDVAALRDQVGSGRREQADPEQFPQDDQTTYSPPRQTWSPVSTSSAGDLESQAPPRPALEAGNASVIAADTSWDGSVQSQGSLHVHGNFAGQIRADGDVFVAESASVSAEVHAGSVTVAGSLEGTVECSGRFEVLPSGRVSADVAAPRLVVHEGALVVGKLRMTSVDEATG